MLHLKLFGKSLLKINDIPTEQYSGLLFLFIYFIYGWYNPSGNW